MFNSSARWARRCGATVAAVAALSSGMFALSGGSATAGVVSAPRVAAATTSADWPSFLNGANHNSYKAGAKAITPANVSNVEPVWRWVTPASPNAAINTLLASPTVVGGVVYIGAMDGDFYAISEATHKVLWSEFLATVAIPEACGPGLRGISATAAVVTDPATGELTVYVNSPDGYLYALDAATGAVDWKGQVDPPDYPIGYYYSYSSPVVAHGNVYVGISSCGDSEIQGGLVAFSQSSGATVATWIDQPPGVVGASMWSSPVLAYDGSIIASTGNGDVKSGEPLYDQSIVKLNPNTLQVESYWQVPPAEQIQDGDFGASPTDFTATINGVKTPMVGDCNKNGYYYAFNQNDLAAGPVWRSEITQPYSNGALECDASAIWNGTDLIEGGGNTTTINGTVYFGSVQALDPATGAVVWQTGLDGAIVGSPTEDGGGVVTAQTYQSDDNNLGVYLLNAQTGANIGFISTPHSPLFGQAVFTGNDLLVGAGDGYGLTDYQITTPGPAITNVSPNTAPTAATTPVTLTFASPGITGTPSVFVGGGAVSITGIVVVSPTEVTFKLAVDKGSTPGTRNITVSEAGTPSVSETCSACLTIVSSS